MAPSETVLAKRTGITRILYTCVHSFNGLKWMFKNEAAFQQELALFIPLSMLAFYLDISLSHSLILVASLLFVLFAELVNTAIEVVIDRISLARHPLSGLAKDIGSSLVLISMLIATAIWLALLV
ncbi:diacylglycerol kinase [Shewanella denitrificans OS217]|jgi:diacylglycerol kinase (ATP)|uniref:Diacylglycerol kinase n=1 Tax=Shewanella denitrificans (strain OS217 / ATCC BAA-1090 / DSM 15013) TaxID=318161 RepID=Q12R35_SHEDO|nr:diacylglycerol kinase [Shewanella denitrificans]ABE54091.1 diacylglycerol kinase [Shewanella denitrificans OS217]